MRHRAPSSVTRCADRSVGIHLGSIAAGAVALCIVTSGAVADKINFKPRKFKSASEKWVQLSESEKAGRDAADGTKVFCQGAEPPFGAPRSSGSVPELMLDKCAFVVRGITTAKLLKSLQRGYSYSSYHDVGPAEITSYPRAADAIGGGALAVYTRTVGVGQKWPAKGLGVGSDAATKIQLVLSCEIYEKVAQNGWRAQTLDNMGRPPGAAKNATGDGWDLWQMQSVGARNRVFNDIVSAKKPIENNEQLHWEKIMLEPYLIAVISTSDTTEAEIARFPSSVYSTTTVESVTKKWITIGSRTVPLLKLSPAADLPTELKNNNISRKLNVTSTSTQWICPSWNDSQTAPDTVSTTITEPTENAGSVHLYDIALKKGEGSSACAGAGASATGSGLVTLSADEATVSVSAFTLSGLSGAASAAHIHASASSSSAGGIVFTITSPTAAQDFTASAYPSSPPSGAPANFAEFVAALKAGRAYVMVHTTACPNGELSGPIVGHGELGHE